MNWPRVVALMPTKNRPQMAHRSIHLFLEQKYEGEKHMLVFDDGAVPIDYCAGCRDHFEHVRCSSMNLPRKRNRMMEHVRDKFAIYFLWDDDDWHGPFRLAAQVPAVIHHRACIIRPTLYYNSITNDLRTSNWISDATAAFDWDFWSKRRFNEHHDPGSGRLFVTKPQPVAEVSHGLYEYMAVVHRGQRHSPPAFGEPDFRHTSLPASWAQKVLRMR